MSDGYAPPFGSFYLDYLALDRMGRGWSETADVVRESLGHLDTAAAEWSPGVRGAVTSFAAQWRTDLTGIATTAEGHRTRMDETIAAYRAGDAGVAQRIPAAGGPHGARPV